MQYIEAPYYSQLLYQYGRCIVKYPQLHTVHLPAGISALQEVRRNSCQVRRAKAAFWLATAYQENGDKTNAGLYQGCYLSEIRQVTKSGCVSFKPITDRVDVSVQIQVIQAVQKYKDAKIVKLKQD
jgi:hypothetical protein